MWYIILISFLGLQVFTKYLNKKYANKLKEEQISTTVGTFFIYLLATLVVVIYFITSGVKSLDVLIWTILVGTINVFGFYFLIKAIYLSLSKTAIFFPLAEVVGIGLGVLFLGEAELWNTQLTLGALLCFGAMYMILMQGRKKESLNKKWLKWFIYTLSMIIIWGVVTFLMKMFSVQHVALGEFLIGWYAGGLLAISLVLLFSKSKHKEIIEIPKKGGKWIATHALPLSAAMIIALWLLYEIFKYEEGALSIVLPLRGLIGTIGTVLLGWFVFHERKGLTIQEWLAFVIGILGGLLIIFH